MVLRQRALKQADEVDHVQMDVIQEDSRSMTSSDLTFRGRMQRNRVSSLDSCFGRSSLFAD